MIFIIVYKYREIWNDSFLDKMNLGKQDTQIECFNEYNNRRKQYLLETCINKTHMLLITSLELCVYKKSSKTLYMYHTYNSTCNFQIFTNHLKYLWSN